MPNIAAVVKDGMRRLARKEVRGPVGPIQTTVHEQRGTIAELERHNADLLRRLGVLEQREGKRCCVHTVERTSRSLTVSPESGGSHHATIQTAVMPPSASERRSRSRRVQPRLAGAPC